MRIIDEIFEDGGRGFGDAYGAGDGDGKLLEWEFACHDEVNQERLKFGDDEFGHDFGSRGYYSDEGDGVNDENSCHPEFINVSADDFIYWDATRSLVVDDAPQPDIDIQYILDIVCP